MSAGGSMVSGTQDAPTRPTPARKKRGCLAQGCLTLLALITITVLVVGALLFRVPQQLGIWPSGARLLDGTPDRSSAAAIEKQLQTSGLDTTGLTVYVMPVTGQAGSLAYAVLDASAGFHLPTATAANPLIEMFRELASGPAVDTAKVKQVALEYRDASGHRLGVLTASTAAIRELLAGQIDEHTFSAELHGDVDPAAVLAAGTTP